MKFLHLADLHLGKVLNDYSCLEDQAFILDQILSLAESEKVEGVLIAGDIYQHSAPSADAIELFDRFLSRLADLHLSVFIISGNHDSARRVSYLSSLVRPRGIHISESFSGKLQTVTAEDEFGPFHVHLLPFIRPADVRPFFPELKIQTTRDAVRAILEASPIDPQSRNILVCHQFVSGALTSDSEDVSVGGLDPVEASLFDDFDYVAMGHIHRPQAMTRPAVRYAGSPLKYSFSEADQVKQITLVDFGAKGDLTLKHLPLKPLRDVRLVEGFLADLMKADYSEDLVWVTVHDELVPPDARVSLRTVFPNMLRFSVVNSRTREDQEILAAESMEEKTVPELFADFFRSQNAGQDPMEIHMDLLRSVLKKMEVSEDEAD